MMKKTLDEIAQTLYDKKGVNILALDVRGISTITDYFIIAEGSVDRHVKALAESVLKSLDKKGVKPLCKEGMESPEWVVLDFGDLMIHLFVPELREKYGLEHVWHEAKVVDLDIVVENIGKSS